MQFDGKRVFARHLLFLVLTVGLIGCIAPTAPNSEVSISTESASTIDLSGIKNYLLSQTAELTQATGQLKQIADRYYAKAEAANFDYAALWASQKPALVQDIEAARAAWIVASPLYEKMEGIVAGTPSLAEFDVILDAGASGAEDPENAAPVDLILPDGRVISKPGNLFGVTESTLWGTFADFTVGTIAADFDGNGTIEFGEALPDANVLKAAAETLDRYANDLQTAANAWTTTTTDAFSALVTMIPTMSEYFASWRDSRFVSGDSSTQRDFVAISRLADIQGILSGLQIVLDNVQPLITTVDVTQGEQIARDLSALNDFVADVYQQELAGKRFSAEEADMLGAEAQNRATAITGQISQVAGQLQIELQ